MAPKKQLTSSTPAVMKPSATFGASSDTSAPSTITESTFEGSYEVVVKPPVLTKMSTLDLVFQAIQTIGVPRKGASYLAILKWIASGKENVATNRLKANLKKAIVKALESGLLKRPTISKNVTGLRGYFMLNKDVILDKKKAEIKTAKKLVEKAKSTKVAKTKTVIPETKPSAAPKTKPAAAPKTKPAAAPKSKPAPVPKSKPAAAPKAKPAAAPKAKPAAAPKAKPAAAPKAKPAAVPKAKSAAAPKAKSATAPKIKAAAETGETTKPKQKTKAAKPKQDNDEAGPSKKLKVKAAVKPRPGKSPVPKSKPKPTAEKHKPEIDLQTDEPQAAKSRASRVTFSTEEDLPHLFTKNAPSKPTKHTKEGRPRKLYNVDSPTNISRKDLSDTELNVKPDNRKSLKSYASDTELEVTYNRKKAKVAKVVKKLDIKKHKETSKTGPSLANVKKRKGKNSTADDVFE